MPVSAEVVWPDSTGSRLVVNCPKQKPSHPRDCADEGVAGLGGVEKNDIIGGLDFDFRGVVHSTQDYA
jgi:hypothetical protein